MPLGHVSGGHVSGQRNTATQEPAACQCTLRRDQWNSDPAGPALRRSAASHWWIWPSAAVGPRVSWSQREATSRPGARQRRAQSVLRTPRVAVAQTQGRPALCTLAVRSAHSHTPQDGAPGCGCGLFALEADSRPLRISQSQLNFTSESCQSKKLLSLKHTFLSLVVAGMSISTKSLMLNSGHNSDPKL